MDDKNCPLSPQEIARQLGIALRGGADADPRGGYSHRKGFRSQPKVESSDPHGVIVWAVDQSKKVA
jgi:hypothetical protein